MMKNIKLLGLVPVLLLTSCNLYNHYVYDEEGYTPLAGTMESFENIKKLDLDWIGGSVYVYQDIEEELTIDETKTDYHLYYKVNNDSLSIKYVRSGLPARIFNKLDKSISVRLPLSFNSLKINAVSTSISLNAVDVNEGEFKIVDGSMNTYYYFAKKTKIDCVSANLYFSPIGCLKNGEDSYFAHEVDIDAVETTADIYYFRKRGYAVDYDGIRCRFTSDYNDQKEYGDKLLKINFDGVKSNLNMRTYYSDYETPEEGEQYD